MLRIPMSLGGVNHKIAGEIVCSGKDKSNFSDYEHSLRPLVVWRCGIAVKKPWRIYATAFLYQKRRLP